MSEVSYQMASWPDEDRLVAEVLVDDEIVAFVMRSGSETELTIPAPFECNLSEFMAVLELVAGEFSELP